MRWISVKLYASIDDVPLPQYASDELVAIKIHMGERGNHSHVRPEDVRSLVERVLSGGARAFVTDTTTLYQRKRATVKDYLETAAMNGFTERSIGCPVIIADSEGGGRAGSIDVAKALLDADCLLVFSHATGHITTGFAGSVKNVAMGCVTKTGKRYIHSAAWPRYRADSCKRCGACTEACPFGFVTLGEGVQLSLSNCPACERCLNACKNGGLYRPVGAMEECYKRYAETCKAVLGCFGRVFFINELNRVTRFCDCSQNPGPTVSPDLGFVASSDPIRADRESVSAITAAHPEAAEVFGRNWEDFIDKVSLHMGHRLC